jgi:predicted dehydrogenase
MSNSQDPNSHNPSRRDLIKSVATAGVAAAAASCKAPAIQSARAAGDQMSYGIIGTGGRGSYLLKHLVNVTNGRCVAVCDIQQEKMDRAAEIIGTTPTKYKDYRDLLNDKKVDAVIIAVPLFAHYPVTRDTLLAGKQTFCEKSLVFTPYEVHALRALVAEHPKQILQVGLQRRYSKFYQLAKQMIDKGMLGDVTHIHAQWHRNPGWVMNGFNWRLFREYSGGLSAELASHQIDVADWFFGSGPEYVIGVGGLDHWKDGRDVYDNIQLIYKYPNNQKLVYSSITTNAHLPYLQGTRPEFGECIMGTEGCLEMTVGDGQKTMPTGMWFKEATHIAAKPAAGGKEGPAAAGASYALASGSRALPLLLDKDMVTSDDGFLDREMKFARRWLYSKGVMTSDEDVNPVETELTAFFNDAKSGAHPKADLETGLHDSIAVMLSNLAMQEERRVYFKEIDTMGKDMTPEQHAAEFAKRDANYRASLAANHPAMA